MGVNSDRWTYEGDPCLLRNGHISMPGLCGAAVSFTRLLGKMVRVKVSRWASIHLQALPFHTFKFLAAA